MAGRDHLARVAGHLEDDLYPGVGGERLERALRDPERIMGDEDHRSGWRRCLGGRRSPELNGTAVRLSVPPQAEAERATTSAAMSATTGWNRSRMSIIGSPFAGITRSRFWSGRQRLRPVHGYQWTRRSLPSQPGVRPELPGRLSLWRLPVGPYCGSGPAGNVEAVPDAGGGRIDVPVRDRSSPEVDGDHVPGIGRRPTHVQLVGAGIHVPSRLVPGTRPLAGGDRNPGETFGVPGIPGSQ